MANRCLCCEQPLEEGGRYHSKCLKALWGRATAPKISFAAKDLPEKVTDGRLCYIVKRFDRTADGGKIQSETMYQLLGSTDKYEGSLESVGKAIRAHAENVGLDTVDFFERVLLCFLIGNGDMHLKNWALLIREKKASLAPVYDLVSSKVYFKREEDSALMISAKKNRLKRSDFERFAAYLKIDPKAAANSFEKIPGYDRWRDRSPVARQ